MLHMEYFMAKPKQRLKIDYRRSIDENCNTDSVFSIMCVLHTRIFRSKSKRGQLKILTRRNGLRSACTGNGNDVEKPMKMPKSIRIMGVDYEIKEVEHLDDGKCLLAGQISYKDSEIRILKNDQSLQNKEITLLHEMFHGLCDSLDLKIINDNESHIDMLARGLYQVIKENPEMFKDERR